MWWAGSCALFCALFLLLVSPGFAKDKMPDPTFDSGHPHVVVPVQHPNGQVDQIAVPTDTSLEDLHGALSDAGYLHSFPTAQPTAAGALENSDDFRNQSKAAWDAVNKGGNPYAESGFSVYSDGSDGGASSIHSEIHPQTSGMAAQWRDKISYGKDDLGIVHTHPNTSSDKPSTNDVEAAKKIKKPIYVTSRTGSS
jgi:hypothetical protein